MLTTDLLDPLKAKCNGKLVERRRFDVIVTEHALQQSPLVDPATRIEFDKIIAHNKDLSGTISGTANNMTIKTTVTNVVSGRSPRSPTTGRRGSSRWSRSSSPISSG